MARPGRPAIKALSTRCLPPWQAALEPGRHHRLLLLAASIAALYAVWSTPLGVSIKAALSVLIGGLFAVQQSQLLRKRILKYDPDNQRWTLTTHRRGSALAGRAETVATGTLVNGGYRSAGLVILLLQADDTRHHRIAIWRDQVEPVQFSYLHYQLSFATQTATRRTLMAWLGL